MLSSNNIRVHWLNSFELSKECSQYINYNYRVNYNSDIINHFLFENAILKRSIANSFSVSMISYSASSLERSEYLFLFPIECVSIIDIDELSTKASLVVIECLFISGFNFMNFFIRAFKVMGFLDKYL